MAGVLAVTRGLRPMSGTFGPAPTLVPMIPSLDAMFDQRRGRFEKARSMLMQYECNLNIKFEVYKIHH